MKYITLFCCLNLAFTSCFSETEERTKTRFLVKAELLGEFSPEEIKIRYSNKQAALFAKNPVKVYRIIYNTVNTDGTIIQASGALLVPVTTDALPLISHHHGTITSDYSAPSNYNSSSEAYQAGTLLASAGTVVSAPDYIGYGASKNIPHPYEHARSLATASRDMLRAVREFCAENKIKLNDKLFLTGYSEGGFATMSLHKLLEENHKDEFTVTASAPGAGAYHKSAFADAVVKSEKNLNYINTYLWVLKTYNKIYGINRPMKYYLNPPYAGRVESAGVFADVSRNPRKLFTPAFLKSIETRSDTLFLNAVRDNDVHDWKPIAPVALFHGTDDDFVPFFNSQNAYNAMKAKGANVKLKAIEGANHSGAMKDYAQGVLVFFSQFLED